MATYERKKDPSLLVLRAQLNALIANDHNAQVPPARHIQPQDIKDIVVYDGDASKYEIVMATKDD